MDRLKDKVAIITGGANGIGLATVKLFLAEGAKVMMVDVDQKGMDRAVKNLNSPNLAFCIADVSKAKDTESYVKETLKVFGKIDIFYNNAGIEGCSRPLVDYPENIFDKVIAVNLKGVWLGCQHVLPKMEEGGSVMITSSVAGLKGFQGLGAYVASKHGVIGIMRVAALESAERKIRVNSIHPGPVDNNMMRRIEKEISPENPEDVIKGFENTIPLKRYADSQEIAKLALFLASDESSYITGSIHVVDGGMFGS